MRERLEPEDILFFFFFGGFHPVFGAHIGASTISGFVLRRAPFGGEAFPIKDFSIPRLELETFG